MTLDLGQNEYLPHLRWNIDMGQSLPPGPELLRSIESLEIVARQIDGGISYTIKGNLIVDRNSLGEGADDEAHAAAIQQVVQDIVAPLALKLILENPGLRHYQVDVEPLNHFVRIPRAFWNIDPVIDELLAEIPIRIDKALPAPHDARPAILH